MKFCENFQFFERHFLTLLCNFEIIIGCEEILKKLFRNIGVQKIIFRGYRWNAVISHTMCAVTPTCLLDLANLLDASPHYISVATHTS